MSPHETRRSPTEHQRKALNGIFPKLHVKKMKKLEIGGSGGWIEEKDTQEFL